MQNYQGKEEIKLKITDGSQNTIIYECDTKRPLEMYINQFAQDIKVNFSSPYVLYKGECLFGAELKKPISEIIKPQDKADKIMTLLLYENTEFDKYNQDEIKIILSIESVKKYELKGIKGEALKNIIMVSSIIKIDLK